MWRPNWGGVVAWVLLLSSLAHADDIGNIYNTKCRRTIDLTEQYAKHTLGIGFKNRAQQPVAAYYVAFPKDEAAHLSNIKASNHAGVKFQVSQAPNVKGDGNSVFFKVDLGTLLATRDEEFDMKLQFTFTHVIKPLPASIAQTEPQLVVYKENHYWYSPYKTTAVWTEVKLPSAQIESYSQEQPTKVKSNVIEYGPYESVDPFKISPLSLHFESNIPFLTATSSVREVTVSHWGAITVEDSVDITHTGAALKGFFSRYDYQSNPKIYGATAIQTLTGHLPASSTNIYYRDEVGNISTSVLRHQHKETIIDLQPRFPLFGGWKTSFTLGYTMPLHQGVAADSKDSSLHKLHVDFGLVFENMQADRHTVKVILPEGAWDIKVDIPFAVEETSSAEKSFLGMSGRPVVILSKENIVFGEHNEPVNVHYRFRNVSMLRQPLMYTFAVLALLSTFILKKRFDSTETTQERVAQPSC